MRGLLPGRVWGRGCFASVACRSGRVLLLSLTDSAVWLSNGSPNLHFREVRIFGASRDWSRFFSVTPNPSSQRKTNSAKSSRLRDRVRSLGLPGTIPSLFAIFPQDSPSTCFARETLRAVAIHLGLYSSLGRPRRFDGRLNTSFRSAIAFSMRSSRPMGALQTKFSTSSEE